MVLLSSLVSRMFLKVTVFFCLRSEIDWGTSCSVLLLNIDLEANDSDSASKDCGVAVFISVNLFPSSIAVNVNDIEDNDGALEDEFNLNVDIGDITTLVVDRVTLLNFAEVLWDSVVADGVVVNNVVIVGVDGDIDTDKVSINFGDELHDIADVNDRVNGTGIDILNIIGVVVALDDVPSDVLAAVIALFSIVVGGISIALDICFISVSPLFTMLSFATEIVDDVGLTSETTGNVTGSW